MKYKWLCQGWYITESGKHVPCYYTHDGRRITNEKHASYYNKRAQALVNDMNERRA